MDHTLVFVNPQRAVSSVENYKIMSIKHKISYGVQQSDSYVKTYIYSYLLFNE